MVRSKSRFRLLVPCVAALGLVVTACGGTRTGPTPTLGSNYPLTIRAAHGTLTITHRPTRIVSLSPTATDDLYAVGAGSQVAAVDAYSTYPPQAPVTKLSETDPNVEAIAGYQPDLVVVADDSSHIVAALAKLSIPVLVEPPASNLNDAYGEIQQLATATDHTDQGKSVVGGIQAQVDAIVHSAPHPTHPLTVYHELDQTFYSATSHTFIGQIYTLLGITNIADKAGVSGDYPQLSAEYVIASNPDLVVLADTVCCGQTAATVASRPGWSNITAVKNGGVVAVDDSIASQWGTRVVLFLRAIADAAAKAERPSP